MRRRARFEVVRARDIFPTKTVPVCCREGATTLMAITNFRSIRIDWSWTLFVIQQLLENLTSSRTHWSDRQGGWLLSATVNTQDKCHISSYPCAFSSMLLFGTGKTSIDVSDLFTFYVNILIALVFKRNFIGLRTFTTLNANLSDGK